MVYSPTFTRKINQMYVDIPYMDPMGYITNQEFDGMSSSSWLALPFPRRPRSSTSPAFCHRRQGTTKTGQTHLDARGQQKVTKIYYPPVI